jgi:hypothetical protein
MSVPATTIRSSLVSVSTTAWNVGRSDGDWAQHRSISAQ